MVIVDSSVLIDLLSERINPQTEWLGERLRRERLGIISLVLVEILQGIRDEEKFIEALNALRRFEIFEAGSEALAVESARNYRALRRRGVTIRNTIDCMLATFCIEEGHILLHRDRDFEAFELHLGLKVVGFDSSSLN